MPYTTFSTDELLEKYELERTAFLEMMIRHPELSKESIEKLSGPLQLLIAELKKRGQKINP